MKGLRGDSGDSGARRGTQGKNFWGTIPQTT